MPYNRVLDHLLVGDHLGQLKKVQFYGEKSDIKLISDDYECTKDNAIVAIRPFIKESDNIFDTIYDTNDDEYLVATETSHLYIYNAQSGEYKAVGCNHKLREKLCSAIPLLDSKAFMFYDKQVDLIDINQTFKHYCPSEKADTNIYDDDGPPKKKKKNKQILAEQKAMIRSNVNESYLSLGKPANVTIHNASLMGNHMAVVGENITLRIFDIQTKQRIFIATPPEPDWLGIKPDIYVTGVDWLGGSETGNKCPTKLVTCSKSDSVVRVYDSKDKSSPSKPVISIDLKSHTFNEYADTPKFTTVAASRARNGSSQAIVVGSTVGHMIGLDLRFAPSGKNHKNHKHLGNLKGSRGASIRDIRCVAETGGQNKIISCSLDRYVRVHNFTKTNMAFSSRNLEKKIFVNTKPNRCIAIYKDAPVSDG